MDKKKNIKFRFPVFLIIGILGVVMIVTLKSNQVIQKSENEELKEGIENKLEEEFFSLKGVSKIENISIENIRVKKINNSKCEIIANIENNSANYIESKVVEVKAIDKNGNMIAEFSGIIGLLAPYEKAEFYTQVLKDITSSEKLEISSIL